MTQAPPGQGRQAGKTVVKHGVPKILQSVHDLELYTRGAQLVSGWVPDVVTDNAPVQQWADFVLQSALQESPVLVDMPHEVDGLTARALAGKVVVSVK